MAVSDKVKKVKKIISKPRRRTISGKGKKPSVKKASPKKTSPKKDSVKGKQPVVKRSESSSGSYEYDPDYGMIKRPMNNVSDKVNKTTWGVAKGNLENLKATTLREEPVVKRSESSSGSYEYDPDYGMIKRPRNNVSDKVKKTTWGVAKGTLENLKATTLREEPIVPEYSDNSISPEFYPDEFEKGLKKLSKRQSDPVKGKPESSRKSSSSRTSRSSRKSSSYNPMSGSDEIDVLEKFLNVTSKARDDLNAKKNKLIELSNETIKISGVIKNLKVKLNKSSTTVQKTKISKELTKMQTNERNLYKNLSKLNYENDLNMKLYILKELKYATNEIIVIEKNMGKVNITSDELKNLKEQVKDYYGLINTHEKFINNNFFNKSISGLNDEVSKEIKIVYNQLNNLTKFETSWYELDSNNPYKFDTKLYHEFIKRKYRTQGVKESFEQLDYDDVCKGGFKLAPQQILTKQIMIDKAKNIQNKSNAMYNNYYYSGKLIVHGLGSGKTCTAMVVSEGLKKQAVDKTILYKRESYRASNQIFLVVPLQLVNQYYKEIKGLCPGKVFINGAPQNYQGYEEFKLIKSFDNSIKDLNEKIRERRLELLKIKQTDHSDPEVGNVRVKDIQKIIDKLENDKQIYENKSRYKKNEIEGKIKTVYNIISHDLFINDLYSEDSTGELIPGKYLKELAIPNSVLIIDEIQNLISHPIPFYNGNVAGKKYIKLYNAIKYHAHPSLRMMLLTATPIFDKPSELGLTINLLRPRIPFPMVREDFDKLFISVNKDVNGNVVKTINSTTEKLFKFMLTGYVSYYKSSHPLSYPKKYNRFVDCPFNSENQWTEYSNNLQIEMESLKSKEVKRAGLEDLVEEPSGIFTRSRTLCNISLYHINPRHGILKINYQGREDDASQKIKSNLIEYRKVSDNSALEYLSEHSQKFYELFKHIIKPSNEHKKIFVFSHYVSNYGAKMIALILDAFGYGEYFKTKNNPDYDFKRYVLWTGDVKEESRPIIQETFNSDKNNGIERNSGKISINNNKKCKDIKIIIGTLAIQQGVSFNHTDEAHLMDQWWNESRMEQIEARVVRMCQNLENAHVKIFRYIASLGRGLVAIPKIQESVTNKFKELKKEAENDIELNAGLEVVDGLQEFMDYNVSVKKGYFNPGLDTPVKGLGSNSVEEYMLSISMRKKHMNDTFLKALKESSMDCSLNNNANLSRKTIISGEFVKEIERIDKQLVSCDSNKGKDNTLTDINTKIIKDSSKEFTGMYNSFIKTIHKNNIVNNIYKINFDDNKLIECIYKVLKKHKNLNIYNELTTQISTYKKISMQKHLIKKFKSLTNSKNQRSVKENNLKILQDGKQVNVAELSFIKKLHTMNFNELLKAVNTNIFEISEKGKKTDFEKEFEGTEHFMEIQIEKYALLIYYFENFRDAFDESSLLKILKLKKTNTGEPGLDEYKNNVPNKTRFNQIKNILKETFNKEKLLKIEENVKIFYNPPGPTIQIKNINRSKAIQFLKLI
jgi:hypothetical protein